MQLLNAILFLIVLLGDHNAKLRKWYENDSTSYEGTKIEGISSQFGMQQLINEPTHILHALSSCIDLIFVSQPNLCNRIRSPFVFTSHVPSSDNIR